MNAEILRRAAAGLRMEDEYEWSAAVADWLDSTANDVEHVHTPVYNLTSTTVARAFAVARRYLGESA